MSLHFIATTNIDFIKRRVYGKILNFCSFLYLDQNRDESQGRQVRKNKGVKYNRFKHPSLCLRPPETSHVHYISCPVQ